MKKIKHVTILVLLSFILSGFLISCNHGMDDEILPDENPIEEVDNEDDNKDDENDDDEDKVTFQSQLDSAQTGSTVTLNKANSGSSITISKGLTVDGNGVENLTVIINSEVASNVSLKNFVNATITISENNRSARNARAVTNSRSAAPEPTPSKPREIGDDNPKLYIENCSFDKIIAEEDVSLYMKEDTLKSRIKEIELKNGVESFVVIEDESENLEKDKKSLIDKITIEKGVDEVELLGGYYKDIEFKGEFTANDKVDFYYDEKGNQVESAFRSYLAEQSAKVNAKDICNVKNGNGIYKFTIPTDEIDDWNDGKVAIFLIKDSHKEKFLASTGPGWEWATLNEPYYEVSSTGYYKFENRDTNLHSICGNADMNYFGSENTTDYYEFYANYSKEGICSQKTISGLDIYVDVSKLLKSDLATCAFKADGNDEYYCQPRKLTEIDLKDYKPYISFVNDFFNEDPEFTNKIESSQISFVNSNILVFPYSKANGSIGIKNGYFANMTEISSYPDVSNVQLNMWKCTNMLELYSVYETGGSGISYRVPMTKFRNEVMLGFSEDQYPFDFYLDEACTQLFWAGLYNDNLEKLYIKPIQIVTVTYFGSPSDYSRMSIWGLISQQGPTIALFSINEPTIEDYNSDNSIKITDINQLIPGQSYYYCFDPSYSPY